MVEVTRGVSEQLGKLEVEDVHGVSRNCRPLLHPSQEGWAVVQADRYIIAWEWRSSLRRVLAGHRNPVQAMVFVDNGSALFSTDGDDFVAWCGASWREMYRARRQTAGKDGERRTVCQMCCLGGGRLVATTEGPSSIVGRGTAHGHVLRVWDPNQGFRMVTEYSFPIHEAPPNRDVQLVSLPGTFDAMALTPWVCISFRHDSVLDINANDPIRADEGNRTSSMIRRWHVHRSHGDEFVGAAAGVDNSLMLLSAGGELTTVDNLHGLEAKRERLEPDGSSPYTSCHVSGPFLSVGALSGGISIFNLRHGRNLSAVCRLTMDPYAQRNVVGRRTEQKHLADGVTVVPHWAGSRGAKDTGPPLPGVVAVSVSDSNKACVTLSEDLSVRVIDVNNRRVSAALWAHHGQVACLAVAGMPMGDTMLISGARDELLVLWNVSRRHEGSRRPGAGAERSWGGVGSVSDGWGGSNPTRGGIYGISGRRGAASASLDDGSVGWQETLSLGEGKSVDLAALAHSSLSFCRKFRRRPAGEEASRRGMAAAVVDARCAAAAATDSGRTIGARGQVDDGPMSASCLAVHPEKNSVACGTAAGKLVLLALPGGELLLDVSSCKTAVAGLSYGPSGRWLAVRERSGRVLLLDAMCGYRRVCEVQASEGPGGDASTAAGYWQGVICLGESLCASAATHLNSSVVHIITRKSLRDLAIYRVNAVTGDVIMPHSGPIKLNFVPAHVAAHPSGHYIFILEPNATESEGRVHLLHLMSAGTSSGFKGMFEVRQGTRTIAADPSGLFVASAQCSGGVSDQNGVLALHNNRALSYPLFSPTSGAASATDAPFLTGQSVVSIWCCMSGDKRAEVRGLPEEVTEVVFLPDASALAVGVGGGQILMLGMPQGLRAEAKRVLFGREPGMHGMTLEVCFLPFSLMACLCRSPQA